MNKRRWFVVVAVDAPIRKSKKCVKFFLSLV